MLAKSEKNHIRSLREKSERILQKQYVAEGSTLVLDLLKTSADSLILLIGTTEWLSTNGAKLSQFSNKIKESKASELQDITSLKSTHDVLAVFDFPQWWGQKPSLFSKTLFLDRINDPGNLGTIIRTCDWYGISQLFLSQNSVDAFNNKTVQATMSSIVRVQLNYIPFMELHALYPDINWYASCLNDDAVSHHTLIQNGIVCMGNEANGLEESIVNLCNSKIKISGSISLGAESLNVAVAAGILLDNWVLPK